MADDKKRPNNQWLTAFRKWHTWLGVVLAGFIVLVCLTGVYLNHKDLFERHEHEHGYGEKAAKGMGDKHGEKPAHGEHAGSDEAYTPLLTASYDVAATPIGFDRAMAIARTQLGADAALEKIELKAEHGELVYKIKTDKMAGEERELIVHAGSGESYLKAKGPDSYTKAEFDAAGKVEASTDWGKLIKHLHTGEFFAGTAGKLLIDLTALVTVFLTVTGVYLWMVPKLRKRQSQKKTAARQAAVASPPAQTPDAVT